MTATFLAIITLLAFGLTSLAQANVSGFHSANAAPASPPPAAGSASSQNGTIDARTLFLKNCAHCHGATARGDEGPDLHDLGLTDNAIANRIRKGKAGEMTPFADKLKPAEIAALVKYVRSVK
jgi:mono/diheme cytochrome c family protein